jgi:NTE family protein
VGFLDIRLAGGLIGGSRLFDALRELLGERPIQDCALSYGAVATDLSSGNEIWLREGSLLDAVRASCALPGLFTPVQRDGRWLVDGGLVNPVPVSLCRAMGADRVIAVDLNSDLLDRYTLAHADEEADAETQGGWPGRLGEMVGRLLKRDAEREEQDIPSLLEVLARSNNIMSVRITRSRMAGEPPDVLLTPRLSRIGLMEFHRAAEAIDAGAAEAHRRSDYLAHL